jgi:hypothetical protein
VNEFKDPTDDAMADLYDSMVAVEQQWSGIRDFLNAYTDRENFSDAGFLREARDLVPGLIGNIARMLQAMNEVITDAESMPAGDIPSGYRPMTPAELRAALEEDARDPNPLRRLAPRPCPLDIQFPNHLPGKLKGCTCPLPDEPNPSKNY